VIGGWREQAACNGDADPDAWFASPLGEPERVARAADICRGCPVQENCLDFAVEIGADYGIWGGLDTVDRRDLGAVQQRTDAWAEAGVRAERDALRKSEQDWRVSLGPRGHQRMTG
jgi:WhiB family redox-sensing transcriptional regulator